MVTTLSSFFNIPCLKRLHILLFPLSSLFLLRVERGLWRLAPVFDINPFPDNDRESKTWLSEEEGSITDIQMLLSSSTYFVLDTDQALAVLAEVHAAVSN